MAITLRGSVGRALTHNELDANFQSLLPLAGGTMSGGITMDSITMSSPSAGVLSFDGSAGQLFSLTDSLTGTIFSVNDVSGIPSIEVDDDGTVRLAEFSGNVLIGTAVDNGSKLQVKGSISLGAEGSNGIVLSESTDRADLLLIKGSTASWAGIQISNTSNETLASFMTEGTTIGIYDDQNNEWAWRYYENGGHTFDYNGTAVFKVGNKTATIYDGTADRTIIHAGNIGSQTVASAGDADTVDSVHLSGLTQSGDAGNGDLNNAYWSSASRLTSANVTANGPGTGWYMIYNNRHRGGTGDGTSYGTQLAIGMNTDTSNAYFRSETGTDTWTSWRKIWNDANDGAGSGLDADNLDGYTWTSSGKNVRATEFYADNWFRNYNSGEGLYNQATTQHFYSDNDDWWNVAGGSTYNGIRFRDEHAGTVRGGVRASNGNYVGFTDASGNWAYAHEYATGNYFYTSGTQCLFFDNLEMQYAGSITAAGNITAYSDERLKDNIKTVSGLDKVTQMRGVTYERNDMDGQQGTGVIAQELQKVAPELVKEGNEYLSVDYSGIVGYLIESIKELKAEIDVLKGEKK